jgi:hypothetical protein
LNSSTLTRRVTVIEEKKQHDLFLVICKANTPKEALSGIINMAQALEGFDT